MNKRWYHKWRWSSLAASCLGRAFRGCFALIVAFFTLLPTSALVSSECAFEVEESTGESVVVSHSRIGSRLRRDPSKIDAVKPPATRWDIIPAATLPANAHRRGHTLANGLLAPMIC